MLILADDIRDRIFLASGLAGVKGEMMELEPSEPLIEVYLEEEKEEDDIIEEDMVTDTCRVCMCAETWIM